MKIITLDIFHFYKFCISKINCWCSRRNLLTFATRPKWSPNANQSQTKTDFLGLSVVENTVSWILGVNFFVYFLPVGIISSVSLTQSRLFTIRSFFSFCLKFAGSELKLVFIYWSQISSWRIDQKIKITFTEITSNFSLRLTRGFF